MLEQFKVPKEIAIRVKADDLLSTVQQLFQKVGLSHEDAALGAKVLVYADIRGIDTHSASNLTRGYVAGFSEERVNPRPNWKVVHETASTATVDGDGGLGTIIAPRIMELAIEKARTAGSGSIAIRNSGHAGPMAYHAHLAANADMIGMAATAGGNSVLPTFGAEGRFGTNPIAFAAPAATEPPFVFDAAMSTIAGGKRKLAQRMGIPMEPGWVAHEDGTPDMDGGAMVEGPRGTTGMAARGDRRTLPLGSTREMGSHKGYGLSMVVEILSGPLSAAAGFATGEHFRRAHFLQAWDIAGFCDVEQFKQDMDGLLRRLRETPPIPGEDRVLYAGLPESELETERSRDGIPMHPEVVDWYRDICAELGVEFTLA